MHNFKNQVYLGKVTNLNGGEIEITGDHLLNSIEIHTNPTLGSFGYNSIVISEPVNVLAIDGSLLTQKPMFDNTVNTEDLDGSLIVNTGATGESDLSIVDIGNRSCNLYPIHKSNHRVYDELGRQVFGIMSTTGANGDLPASDNVFMSFAVYKDDAFVAYELPAGDYQYREQLAYSFINARIKNLSLDNEEDIGSNIEDIRLRTFAKFEYSADSNLLNGSTGFVPTFKLTMDRSTEPVFEMRDPSNTVVAETGNDTSGIALKPIFKSGTAYSNEVDFYVNGIKIKDELVNVVIEGNDATVYANLLDGDYVAGNPVDGTVFELVYYGKYATPGPLLTVLPRSVVNEEEASTIEVLDTAFDPNGLPLTLEQVIMSENGTAVINNGEITFTPNPGFLGTAEIYYSITNGEASTIGVFLVDVVEDSSIVDPAINPTGIPLGPIASIPDPTVFVADATVETIYPNPITVDVLPNDLGEDLVISSINSDNGTGTVVIENNKIKYTPGSGDDAETITIMYTISGANGTDNGTLLIDVLYIEVTEVVADADVNGTVGQTLLADVLANDQGEDLTITSIDSNTGAGVATVADNKISYVPTPDDAGTTVTVTYSTSGDNGTDNGTLNIVVPDFTFSADYQTENVGDVLDFDVTGDFYVDYGDGNWVGPTSTIDQPSTGTGAVRIRSNNATKVNSNDIFTSVNIDVCDDIADASNMFKNHTKMTTFTVGDDAFKNTTTMDSTWSGCTGLTSFPVVDTSGVTTLDSTWNGCSALTEFPVIDTSSVTELTNTWNGCAALATFPLLNTSGVTSAVEAWAGCSTFTEFPLLDLSNATSLAGAWSGCSALTDFPLIDTSSAEFINNAWSGCTSMVTFPVLDTSSVKSFSNSWNGCSALTTFPLLDTSAGLFFNNTWNGCSALESFPAIDTSAATEMNETWKDCTSLVCLSTVNTLNAAGNKNDMFVNTPALVNPTAAELTQITSSFGMNYVNAGDCPFVAALTVANDDGSVNGTVGVASLVDVLANDEGGNLTIASIDANNGTGVATIVGNKINYVPSMDDAGNTVTIEYTISGDNGTDTNTIDIVVPAFTFDGTYKTENVGDVLAFDATGDFFIDYGDGNVVGPVAVIDQPSVGTGEVKIKSTNAVKVKSNNIFTDIHIEKCDDIVNAHRMFFLNDKLTTFTVGVDAFKNTTNFGYTWFRCSGLTSFPLVDTSSGTDFTNTWYDCSGLTSFATINTSSATNISGAWKNCTSLTSFPLIDTSNVNDMSAAWTDCSSLTSFPVIDASSAYTVGSSWQGCTGLTSFPLIDLSFVKNFGYAWKGCTSLTDFPLIDTSVGTTFASSWQNCTGLISFPLLPTNTVTKMDNTWENCSSLTSFPLLDTSNVTKMGRTWFKCASLTDFPAIDTSSVTTMSATWAECTSMTTFPVINASGVTQFYRTWYKCTSLTTFPSVDTSGATEFRETWQHCSSLTSFSIIDASNVTMMYHAWHGCVSLLSFPSIVTTNVTDMIYTWYDCTHMETFSPIDTTNVTNMDHTWYKCNELISFPLINTSNVTKMPGTWSECNELTEFPLLDTSSVTEFINTWEYCNSLLTFPAIDTSSATKLRYAWSSCNAMKIFPAIDTSNVLDISGAWRTCSLLKCMGAINTLNATNKYDMLANCPVLENPTAAERVQLESSAGLNYINPDICNLVEATLVVADPVVTCAVSEKVLVDVLTNDEGENLVIDSIVTNSGNGVATIVDNKIEYLAYLGDENTTVTIEYTISGDNGTDTGTLDISVTEPTFFATYQTENVGDYVDFTVNGSFIVDYGDGNWVGPVTTVAGNSVGTGSVKLLSNNATQVKSNNIFTAIHIEKCDDIVDATDMFKEHDKLVNFTTGVTAFQNVVNLNSTWYSCTNMVSFPVINSSNVVNLQSTWYNCPSLTSFPLIDTSSVTLMANTWQSSTGLTSFPLIDTSNVTNFTYSWKECTGLEEFPAIDTANGNDLYGTWYKCSSLTSFPLIDTSSATTMISLWDDCTNLVCIGGVNTTNAGNKDNMFLNTPSLVNPTSAEQTQIVSTTGLDYVNANPCPAPIATEVVADNDVLVTAPGPVITDILANDLGENLTIQTIDSNSGAGTASIVGNQIQYIPSPGDMGTTVSIGYTISGDGGTDNGTLNIVIPAAQYDATYKTENVGDNLSFIAIGDFMIDYGDGNWVGPVTSISGPSLGTGTVRILSNNATKVIGNNIFTEIHVEKCDTILDAAGMFRDHDKMTTFTAHVDAFKNTTNMANTWRGCKNLTTFPVINTSNVTDMTYTWSDCDNFTTFTAIDTSNVTIMHKTWESCNNLTSFPLIDTSSVTDMSYAWAYAPLTSFPLIDTSSVINLSGAWTGNSSLTSFPAINTGNVTSMERTWYNCTNLTGFPLIDTSSVVNLKYTWYKNKKIASFPLINTQNVTAMDSTWTECLMFTSFPAIDTSSVTALNRTWFDCKNLTSFPLIDTSSVITIDRAWYFCESLTEFPLIDLSNATSIYGAWNLCRGLTTFPLIDTSNVGNFKKAWSGCEVLTEFPAIDTSSGTNMRDAWRSCEALTSFPVIDTSNVTDLSHTWAYCTNLICIGAVDSTSATSKNNMFYSSPALQSPDLAERSLITGSAGSVYVNPNPCPVLPTAVVADPAVTVLPGETVVIDVLANDEGGSLVIDSIDGNTGNGTATIVGNKINYEAHPSDEDSTITISYSISGTIGTDSGTVDVMILKFSYIGDFTTENVGDTLTLSTTGNFYVDYGDGVWTGPATSVSGASLGTGVVKVRSNNASKANPNNVCTAIHIEKCNNITNADNMFEDLTKLVTFTAGDDAFMNTTSMKYTWHGCTSMTTFGAIDSGNVTDVQHAWEFCASLVEFPLIDLSNAVTFISTWRGCDSFTSFPMIDLSSAKNLSSAWYECINLQEFPLIDFSSVEILGAAWRGCTSLTTFPLIDTSNVTNMFAVWYGCTGLTHLPAFDTSSAGFMFGTFQNCTNLVCIGAVNTTNANNKTSMFSGTPNLQHPTSAERSALTSSSGSNYVNSNPCP